MNSKYFQLIMHVTFIHRYPQSNKQVENAIEYAVDDENLEGNV